MKNKIKKTLCTLLTATSLATAYCGGYPEMKEISPQKEIILYGKPLSADYFQTTKYTYGRFAGVFEVNGKQLLTYSSEVDNNFSYLRAKILVESEINDGDNELVELRGHYNSNESEFILSSIKANGYKSDFNKDYE